MRVKMMKIREFSHLNYLHLIFLVSNMVTKLFNIPWIRTISVHTNHTLYPFFVRPGLQTLRANKTEKSAILLFLKNCQKKMQYNFL